MMSFVFLVASEIVGKMGAIIIDRAAEPLAQIGARRPARHPWEMPVIGPVLADIDALALRRKLLALETAAAGQFHHHLGQLGQADRWRPADVEHLPDRRRNRCGREEGVHNILDETEVPALFAAPDFEATAL